MRTWKTAILFLSLLGTTWLVACEREVPPGWQGYGEGEYIYVATPRGGRLLELAVRKGETVASGAPLFRLDPEPEATAVEEARRRLDQAGHRRDDLARGERPSEIDALRARLRQARVALALAKTELDRYRNLVSEGAVSREQFDRRQTDFDRAEAEVAQLEAELVTAGLGGRIDQRRALEAETEAAAEALSQAEWNLAQKSPTAVGPALVFDTLFEVGELVPANAPVVVLLPPAGRKARFYVPEEELAGLRPGGRVTLRFDGGSIPAAISYLSPQAEYTPPVIYSRETRAKLVYLLEARPAPADAERLTPGMPLEVTPE